MDIHNGIYTQPWRKIKSWNLKVNGCNWKKITKWRNSGPERPTSCFLSHVCVLASNSYFVVSTLSTYRSQKNIKRPWKGRGIVECKQNESINGEYFWEGKRGSVGNGVKGSRKINRTKCAGRSNDPTTHLKEHCKRTHWKEWPWNGGKCWELKV